MKLHVFSYGSNMCLRRIRERAPSAEPVCTGWLARHELRFHKLGRDGSAKADAFHTGDDAHSVWGVVFAVHVDDKPIIDRCESLGVGYDERHVSIRSEDHGTTFLPASVYLARSEMIRNATKPFTWYKELVLAGARQHGAPRKYLEALHSVESRFDPDRDRHLRHLRLIEPA